MPEHPRKHAELAFGPLIASEDVEFISEQGDLHIAGDDWTLVLEGDPITDVLIALEDEVGPPETALQEGISEEEFAAIRDLDARLEGELISHLTASSDVLATTLAELLER